MKRVVVIIAIAVLVILTVILLVKCNSSEVMRGGENTAYPYTWQEKSNGSVVIKLDGSKATDYLWKADNSDPSVVGLETSKAEKNGEITYTVTPVAQGSASITFSRLRELNIPVAEVTDADNAPSSDAGTSDGKRAPEKSPETEPSEKVIKTDTPPEPLPLESEEMPGGIDVSESAAVPDDNTAPVDYTVTGRDQGADGPDETNDPGEVLRQRYTPKDIVSEITIVFEVTPSEKNGKLTAKVYSHFEKEYTGLTRSSDASVDYKLWNDQTGALLVRIPFEQESWEISWEGDYYEPVSNDQQSDRLVLVPELVDGKYEIASVRRIDAVDGDEIFEITGLGAGHANITFTSEVLNRKVVVEVRISEDGAVSLISHKTE